MSQEVTELREFALAVLKRRYGSVNLMKGQGVQAGTRVEFEDGGARMSCAVKAATGASARIHFPYHAGEWGTLSQVDRVLCVRNLPGANGEFEARMYRRETLVDAFNENRRAAEAGGFTNLPAWLSADKENEPRFAGSGFARFVGFLALILASVNIFGGFMVTERMLAMYKKKG